MAHNFTSLSSPVTFEEYWLLGVIEVTILSVASIPSLFFTIILYRAPCFHRNLIALIVHLLVVCACVVPSRLLVLWINMWRVLNSKSRITRIREYPTGTTHIVVGPPPHRISSNQSLRAPIFWMVREIKRRPLFLEHVLELKVYRTITCSPCKIVNLNCAKKLNHVHKLFLTKN